MKKILIIITADDQANLFDTIVGYDAGADICISYPHLDVAGIPDLVYDAIFTRKLSLPRRRSMCLARAGIRNHPQAWPSAVRQSRLEVATDVLSILIGWQPHPDCCLSGWG